MNMELEEPQSFDSLGSDDLRSEELESLKAIFNELSVNYEDHSGHISIPVNPINTPSVKSIVNGDDVANNKGEINLDYFPSLSFSFRLTQDYPDTKGPKLNLGSFYNWLPPYKLQELKDGLNDIYEQTKDMCVYSMIDYLNEEASNFFQLKSPFMVNDQLYDKFIEFNKKALQGKFNEETYECEICQSDKKGADCLKLPRCGHVFCSSCFVDYLVSCINSNQSSKLHCPNSECVERFQDDRNVFQKYPNGDVFGRCTGIPLKEVRKMRKLIIEPYFDNDFMREILRERPEMLEKYLELFHEKKIENYEYYFPDETSRCPRVCGTRYIINEAKLVVDYQRDPYLLERDCCGLQRESSDDETSATVSEAFADEDEEEDFDGDDKRRLLLICPQCRFAYCSSCRRSWHGKSVLCYRKSDISKEVIEQYLEAPEDSPLRMKLAMFYGKKSMYIAVKTYFADKEFEEFLETAEDLVKCPGCGVVTQRFDGCNKMECLQCEHRFCNLCGSSLMYGNPYDHFNEPFSPCYGKLFEGLIKG